MNRLASPAQLRASLLRWALFLVPTVMLLGFLSGQVSGSGADDPWFAALTKPDIYPPPITFGIVWTILYAVMGFALALVCSAWGARWRPWAVLAFLVQFVLNLAWSPVFFAKHDIVQAQALLFAIDIMLIVTIYLFWKVRRSAFWLMLPYLGWVLFATVLNWQFLQLNPDASELESNNAVQRVVL